MSTEAVDNSTDLSARGAIRVADIDQLREVLVGWDTDPVQLGKGRLHFRYEYLRSSDFNLARMSANRLMSDLSAHQERTYTFVVCMSRLIFCCIEAPPGSVVLYGPGRDYRSVLPTGWRSLEVTVTERLIHERGLEVPNHSALAPERSVFPLNDQTLAEFVRLEQKAFRLDIASEQSLTTSIEPVRDWCLDLLFRALSGAGWNHSDRSAIHPVACYDLARAALELIDDWDADSGSASGVAKQLGVSPRMLQLAFRSAGLCSPGQYMLARRLNMARRYLVANDCHDRTVTEAAIDQRFSHLGRFSEHFRRLFGERPSEALQRASAHKP